MADSAGTPYLSRYCSQRKYKSKVFPTILALISVFCILLLTSNCVSAAVSYELKGWNKEINEWKGASILKLYSEYDCIPMYVQVINDGPALTNQKLVIDYNYMDGGIVGIVDLYCCGCTDCPSPNPLSPSPCCSGTSLISTCPVTGSISKTQTGDISKYTWTYNIGAGTSSNPTILTQCFCALLGPDASLFPGASMSVGTDKPGTGTVSIPPDKLAKPDLTVTKVASQNCDKITYTITYTNIGAASQLNTVLIDTYDKTKVTPIDDGTLNDGKTADGGVIGDGTITWTLGTLDKNTIGWTKTFQVTINNGGCSGTIRNYVSIDGDRNDANSANNLNRYIDTIVSSDTTKPQIGTCPADITIECPDPFPENPTNDLDGFKAAGGAATDNCNILKASYTDVTSGSCPEVITRTWKIEDACGNFVTCDQKISRDDTQNPEITTCPPTETYDCSDDIPTRSNDWDGFKAAGGDASDDCDNAPDALSASYTDSESGTLPGTVTITRTWKVEDDCGNFDTCDQIITITNVLPTVELPPLVTVCIASNGGLVDLTGLATITGDYDSVLWEVLSGRAGSFGDPTDINTYFAPLPKPGDLLTTTQLQLTVIKGTPGSGCYGTASDTMEIKAYQVPLVEIHIDSPQQV